MDDADIAHVLRSFADLLEVAGENPFRSNAYRRAADALDALAVPSSELTPEELEAVPGIGQGTAAAIHEIGSTGRYEPFDELTARVPESLLSLLEVSGVGAKTAGRFYRELGVTDLATLEQAAESGRIRTLKGLGPKQEQKILDSLAFLRSRSDRLNIGEALPQAELLASTLSTQLGTKVLIAGSIRRRCETVGNIDLVAETTDAGKVEAALLDATEAYDVEAGGADYVEAMLPDEVPLRIALSEPGELGGALVRWTGNAEHLAALRERAGHELPVAPDEEGVYAALRLEWIPPELRQGRDEIELAAAHALPPLVTLRDLKGDLHLHSEWSDGHATILELAQAAKRRGYRYLSISDHSGALGVAHGLSVERLREQRRVIDQVNEQVPEVRLLRSAEVEVRRDGTLDFPDEVLAELDIVVASLHSGLRSPVDELTRRIVRVLENPHVDIVAHPTGRIVGRRPEAPYDWDAVFRAARETGTALEINANPARQDLKDTLARAAVEAGAMISIDSDAHDLASLDLISYGVGIARRAGIGPDSVVNAKPLPDLLDWLAR